MFYCFCIGLDWVLLDCTWICIVVYWIGFIGSVRNFDFMCFALKGMLQTYVFEKLLKQQKHTNKMKEAYGKYKFKEK